VTDLAPNLVLLCFIRAFRERHPYGCPLLPAMAIRSADTVSAHFGPSLTASKAGSHDSARSFRRVLSWLTFRSVVQRPHKAARHRARRGPRSLRVGSRNPDEYYGWRSTRRATGSISNSREATFKISVKPESDHTYLNGGSATKRPRRVPTAVLPACLRVPLHRSDPAAGPAGRLHVRAGLELASRQ